MNIVLRTDEFAMTSESAPTWPARNVRGCLLFAVPAIGGDRGMETSSRFFDRTVEQCAAVSRYLIKSTKTVWKTRENPRDQARPFQAIHRYNHHRHTGNGSPC